jgi:branched-chain amino acid transport system substrate-binding protein
VSHVVASLPLSGPFAAAGREVLLGARLALEARTHRLDLVELDSFGPDRDAQAAANARRAAEDPNAAAYVGDFHSSQVRVTAPLLGDAGLLQVAPVATMVGLGGPTLVRLMPHDGMGAAAAARWLAEHGVRSVLVVHDEDREYGLPVGRMCAEAAKARGAAVRLRPVWDEAEATLDDLDGAEAVLYVGVAGSGAPQLWQTLHEADPDLWLLGMDGLAVPAFARDLDPAAAERTRFFVPQRAPLALYGFEAMALALDAIESGGPSREGIVGAARATRDRSSTLGSYSVDADGLTTSQAYGLMRIVDRQLVWA